MIRIIIVVAAVAGVFFGVRPAHAAPPPVVLHEVMWMGSPASAQDEWIELFNTTAQDVDLAGWRMTKLSSGVESDMLTITSGIIPAHGFFVIANYAAADDNSSLLEEPDVVDTAISLVNTKFLVRLYDASGTEVDVADEGVGAPFAGKYVSGARWASMERHRTDIPGDQEAAWHTSSAPYGSVPGFFATPGAANSNSTPEVVCEGPTEVAIGSEATFFATATDADDDALLVQWEVYGEAILGDTLQRAFTDEGEVLIRCSADDGRARAESTMRVFVRDDASVMPPESVPPSAGQHTGTTNTNQVVVPYQTSDRIFLTALLPNPAGTDATGEFIEVTNFGDADINLFGWSLTDGSRTYLFDVPTVVPVGDVLRVPREQSTIALNNSGDTVHLIDPFGKKINGVEYDAAPEGELFLRDGETIHWFWTGEDAEEPVDAVEEKDAYQQTTIAALPFLVAKTKVTFAGVVVALPGQIAAHTLFIADGDALIRVYSSADRFPQLALDDVVAVRGAIAQDQSGEKVNIGSDGGVEKIDAAFGESVVTTVQGTVQEKNRTRITLETDAGAVIIRIKPGTGIPLTEFSLGATVRVTGFLFDQEVLPRTPDDIQVLPGTVLAAEDTQTDTGQEAATSAERVLPPAVPQSTHIAIVLIGAVLAGGIFFFIRSRRPARP